MILAMFASLLLAGCSDDAITGSNTTGFDSFVLSRQLEVTICDYAGGCQAALTFSFDDVRRTSHEYAAPLLEEHGWRGSFNLNTRAVGDRWEPWIALHERGHELTNHTWGHQRLTELPVEQAREEIARGRADLLSHVPGLQDVVSFVYPEGQSSPEVRSIVLEDHLSARAYWGWNPPLPDDYAMLSGRSWRGLEEFVADIEHAFSRGAWLIQYFHGVVDSGPTEDEWRAVLQAAAAREDSLWVATQGEITKYTLAHAQGRVLVIGDNPAYVFVDGVDDPRLEDVVLTLSIRSREATLNVLDIGGQRHYVGVEDILCVDCPVGDTLKIVAHSHD